MAKVLANRLEPKLEHLIGDQQTKFIVGGDILDGVVIAKK